MTAPSEARGATLDQALAELRADGMTILRGIVSDPVVADLKRAVDVERESLAKSDPVGVARISPYLASPAHTGFLCPFREPFMTSEILCSPGLVSLTEAYLGMSLYLHELVVNLSLAGHGTRQTPHPDQEPEPRGPVGVVWNVALGNVGPDNGMTEIYSRTHHGERAELGPPIQPQMVGGDVLIRDLSLYHNGAPNPSPDDRALLAYVVKPPWQMLSAEFVSLVDPRVWDSQDKQRRMLLRRHRRAADSASVVARAYPIPDSSGLRSSAQQTDWMTQVPLSGDSPIDRVVVLSYYHPWIAGGGHRPHQITLEDLRADREICFIYYSDAEPDSLAAGLASPEYQRLALFKAVKAPGIPLVPMSPHADELAMLAPDGCALLSGWAPAYVRSHNPVDTFLPLLEHARSIGIPHLYDIMDDWHAFPRQPWGPPEIEDGYLLFADAVAVVSRVLRYRAGNVPSRLVPNGVSHSFIDRIARTNRIERRRGAPKRVLYMGAMWPSWFDWELVGQVADQLQDHEFTLVGPVTAAADEDDGRDIDALVRSLQARPNVVIAPEVLHDDLPEFLQAADVAMVPFVVNEVTKACSPLKVFEYLASTLPVVCTMLPELDGYPQVKLASDAAGFCRMVAEADRAALSDEDAERMRAFVSRNTWRQRTADLEDLIRSLSPSRQSVGHCASTNVLLGKAT